MDSDLDLYHCIPIEIRDYYEKVSKGLIEEKPYDYWGEDTAEEKELWDERGLPIKMKFRPIHWDSSFTGRGSKLFIFFHRGGLVAR